VLSRVSPSKGSPSNGSPSNGPPSNGSPSSGLRWFSRFSLYTVLSRV
jgi:hypothetical protein